MPVVVRSRCPQDHDCPCVRLCPVDAVSQQGCAAPRIDREKCIECGACAAYCPYRAIIDSGREKIRGSSITA